MIAFGFGEFFGSHLIGFLIDKFNSRRAALFIMVFVALMMASTLEAIDTPSYGLLTFLMTFFWGLQDASINVQLF